MGKLSALVFLAGVMAVGGLQSQTLSVDTKPGSRRIDRPHRRHHRAAPDSQVGDSQEPSQERHIAWLVGGQVSRFIYKDSLQQVDGGIASFAGCTGCVDMHIVLANTHARAWAGPYVLPTYEDGSFEEAYVSKYYETKRRRSSTAMIKKVDVIKDELEKFGVRQTFMRIIAGEQYEQDIGDFYKRMLKRARRDSNMTEDDFNAWLKATVPNAWRRFRTSGNLMYMRHLAYSSAIEAEKTLPFKYSHILLTKDDNVFVHPQYTLLQLAMDMDKNASLKRAPPALLVDRWCGFGAYSDKMYFATRNGIDILVPRTLDRLARSFSDWIHCQSWGCSGRSFDPLQSETFFQHVLSTGGAQTKKFDFSRTEARYVPNMTSPCTPKNYFGCTRVPIFDMCPYVERPHNR